MKKIIKEEEKQFLHGRTFSISYMTSDNDHKVKVKVFILHNAQSAFWLKLLFVNAKDI